MYVGVELQLHHSQHQVVVSYHLHGSVTLPQGNSPNYPLYRRMVRPQRWSGCYGRNLLPILETDSPFLLSSSLKPRWYHHHNHWHDSPLWALAFLRIVRHSSPFDATLLQFFTPKILMSYHTFFTSQSWSSHFPISFWFSIKYFLNRSVLASAYYMFSSFKPFHLYKSNDVWFNCPL
jgi:hypothetical protein